jgi:hypothetical protein
MGRRARAELGPRESVDRILADPRILWLPIRHHSPGCALHVERVLRERRPVAVLVEGPDDAQPQIEWIAHPESEPPLVVLFSFTDPETEERVRVSWPLLRSDPEWVAIRVGSEIGADVRLIDAPARAANTGRPTPGDERMLAESLYFFRVAQKSRRTTFDGWWEATFESRASSTSSEAFFRGLLLFAWCSRRLGDQVGQESEVVRLREAHFRWHVDEALARHPEGPIAVVVGASHAVALPDLRGKRTRPKADKTASVLLSATSDRAVARLGVAWPGWIEARRSSLDGDEAAKRILVEVARQARAGGLAVGTADAVGAVEVARGLAKLRGGGGIAAEDVLDAVLSAFVKGSADAGAPVLAVARRVLEGGDQGHLPEQAGRPPLVEDFFAELRLHRIELGDEAHEVRCDLDKQEKHRAKSAFFHRCALLGIPMFGGLEDGEAFHGPDLVERTDLHLSIERWGVQRQDGLDDVLLELTDRGPTVALAARAALEERAEAARSDASELARVLLHAARTRTVELLPPLLAALGDAVARDADLAGLVDALGDLVLLHRYRDALATRGSAELEALIEATWERATLALPEVRHAADEAALALVERVVALARYALTRPQADRRLLVEHLEQVARDPDGQPLIRGATHGLLATLGATTPRAIGGELERYLRGPFTQVRRGAAFLEGVLRTSRSTFLASPRLLESVHEVLSRLGEDEFLMVLPDLRRAFAVFVPVEIERIGENVGQLLVGDPAEPELALSPDAAARARPIDARIARALRVWFPEP